MTGELHTKADRLGKVRKKEVTNMATDKSNDQKAELPTHLQTRTTGQRNQILRASWLSPQKDPSGC